jgi:hypothetical protein
VLAAGAALNLVIVIGSRRPAMSIADQIIAPLCLAVLLGFLGFLAVYIGEFSLWTIILAVAMLAVTDFVQTLREERQSGSDGS